MKIENTELFISRVEIIKKTYGDKGEVIQEEWQYYYPKDRDNIIEGFKSGK